MTMLHTTLALLRRHRACKEGYQKLVKHLGRGWKAGEPISLLTVRGSNGVDDALWCLKAVLPEEEAQRDQLARLLSADYAEHVQHLYVPPSPDTGWRPQQSILAARRHALGSATREEWAAAGAAAEAAAWAAVRDATWEAAGAAARAAAWAAAGAAARAAAWAAAWAAAKAAARTAAGDATWEAVREAEEERQAQLLRAWLTGARTPDDVRREMVAAGTGAS